MSIKRRGSNVIWSAEQAVVALHAADGSDSRVAVLHAYLGLKAARGKTRAEVRAKLLGLAASVPEYADAFVRVGADLGLGPDDDDGDVSPQRARRRAGSSTVRSGDVFASRPPPRSATSDDAAHTLAHHHALAGFARRSSAAAASTAQPMPPRLAPRPAAAERRGTAVSAHELTMRLDPYAADGKPDDANARELRAAASLAGGYESEDEWEAYTAAAAVYGEGEMGRRAGVRM